MIPKIIHYCWFGGNPLPELAKKCIASWKKYCPDYEIIRWDESNYDFSKLPFMKQAYQEKKWAYVTDYARLDIIYTYGGIYFDTDVEVLRSFDDLLSNRLFLGFEIPQAVATGLGFGGEAGHPVLKMLRNDYDSLTFSSDKMIPCPQIQTKTLKKLGLVDDFGKIQELTEGTMVYPQEYFCPKSYRDFKLHHLTENTHTIHHFNGSWLTPYQKMRKSLYIFCDNHAKWLWKILSATKKVLKS